MKNKLPTGKIVDEPTSPIFDRDEKVFRITPQQKAEFYEEVYEFYMEYLEKKNNYLYSKYREMQKYIASYDGFDMLLYMFKRIAPTLCDLAPLNFLQKAIVHARAENNFDHLCTFMQIAAFRWSRLEKGMKQCAQSRVGREGNKWENTHEGQVIAPIFNTMEQSQKSFAESYEEEIVKALASNPKIWKSSIRNLLKNWRSQRKVTKKERIATVAKYLVQMEEEEATVEFIAETLLKIPELEKQFQDKYRRWKSKLDREYIVFFKSIGVAFSLREMQERWWTQMEPWPIEDCLKKYWPAPQQEIGILLLEASKLSSL